MKNTMSFNNQFECSLSCGMGGYAASEGAARRTIFALSGLLFSVGAIVTVLWCNSMSAMGEMRMPGGWAMSMTWMRMPGQTWIGAAAWFLAMWVVMMAAMMLPSLAPMLGRYRQAISRTGESRLTSLTLLAGLGYFFVWALFGLAIFPLGVLLATAEMEHSELARAVPMAIGVVILIAGAVQLTSWKARHLASCRETPAPGRTLLPDVGTAWRQGVRFGFHCGLSCANLTAILLVIGVMNLRAMAFVTAAITAKRLAPAGKSVARAIGVFIVGVGLLLILRAVTIG
jgi:predicted metal-binding membrane protein